jgi:hypothetical protein
VVVRLSGVALRTTVVQCGGAVYVRVLGFDFFLCYVLIFSQLSAICCCFSVFTADLGLDFMVGVVVLMGLWWFLLHRLCFTGAA